MRIKALIYLDRFKENINLVKDKIGEKRLICVPIKADAYGHGALQIAKTSLESGAFCFGVAAVSEGVELRKGGIKAPILVFSQSNPDDIPEIIENNLTPFISDIEFASILNEEAGLKNAKLSIHIKIDTGMGRMGCSIDEALQLTHHIMSCSNLKLEGIATHLAVSDSNEKEDTEFTKIQIERFKTVIDKIRAEGIDPGIVHAANSGAILQHPESYLDMVRPGLLLYGYNTVNDDSVKPVMELRSTVVLIKKIKKGETVSYGRTWTADKDTFIAIISAGYADGLPRLASNKWQVTINGKTFPLIGRVSMDQCCVNLCTDDVKNLPVKRWDEVIIFGALKQDAASLAQIAQTIPYEITCNINMRVPRVYI
ncbi:MAG: alanine racemase [Treponema sp.]|nr:alanine racemase [Treponema sp.]